MVADWVDICVYLYSVFGDSGNTSPYFTITSPMLAAMADFALSN